MSGWLPVEARDTLEAETEKASAAEAERLLALPPRERVLVLMDRAVPCTEAELTHTLLRPADLVRVLESFAGPDPVPAEGLADRFPCLCSETAEP